MLKNFSITITTLILSLNVYAGTGKLGWKHDGKDTSGLTVAITKYRAYCGLQGQPLTQVTEIGPPAPGPWKIDTDGAGVFSKTVTKAEWLPGQIVCCEITAFADTLESAHSTQACKAFTGSPSQPFGSSFQ